MLLPEFSRNFFRFSRSRSLHLRDFFLYDQNSILYGFLKVLLVLTRYTVHGRGAKHGSVEHIISVWIHSRPVSNGDSFQSVCSRMPSLASKNHFWAPFCSWRHQRQFKTVRFLHPLPKVKVTGHVLHFFSKNATFFRPKKGPRTGLSHSLTRLTAIQFWDHAKSKAQITERIFNEAPPQMPFAKINYFPKPKEKKCTSVFLHCRMDRALRATIKNRWMSQS